MFGYQRHLLLKDLSVSRIEKVVYSIYRIALEFNKDFEDATKQDIEQIVEQIDKRDWADRTKSEYKVCLRLFFRWLRRTEFYPTEVSWIKIREKNNHRLPEEILTKEEVKRIADAAECPRDRALVLVMYESGCRIGELLSLKIRNIQFDQFGAQLIVNGKTGMRRVRIIASCPALSSWLEVHALKSNPASFVWIVLGTRNKYAFIGYQSVASLLRKLAKKAGIRKRVNPPSFRHARATHLASLLTESQMKEYFGWTQASDMASIYVHLSGRDVDDALLKLHGLVKSREKEESMKTRTCLRCREVNDPIAEFCKRCGSPMDPNKLIDIREQQVEKNEIVKQVLNELAKDENISRQMYKVINKLGLKEKLAAYAMDHS